MTGKKLVIFAGSQDIQDAAISESLYSELGDFLSKNRDRITEVLFGGGKYGVMGKVFEVSKKVGIAIRGYSIERFRQYDEGNGVDIDFYPDDVARMNQFTRDGDLFLALPGGVGTLSEVFGVCSFIKEMSEEKKIFVPKIFGALHDFIFRSRHEGMLHGKDEEVIRLVDSITDIEV